MRTAILTAAAAAAAAALFASAWSAGGAVAGEAVIIASTAPEHRPGMIIAEDLVLSLPAGTGATVLFASGRTQHLSGPFHAAVPPDAAVTAAAAAPDGGAAAAAARLRSTWGDLVGTNLTAVGGTRSFTPAARARPRIGDTR